MATSIYFNNTQDSAEQTLLEDLVAECIRNMGLDIIYIGRTAVNPNSVLGEDTAQVFDKRFEIECYVQEVEGFSGQIDMLSKLGIQIDQEATFLFSKSAWEEFVFDVDSTRPTPKEGDLIFFPLTNIYFQINHVTDQSPFLPLGKNTVFQCKASAWRNPQDTVETGDTFIDGINGAIKLGTIAANNASSIDGLYLGTVLTIQSDTQLTLDTSATDTVSSIMYRVQDASAFAQNAGDNQALINLSSSDINRGEKSPFGTF